MADAEAKAKQLINLSGVTFSKTMYISEGSQAPFPPCYEMQGGGMAPAPMPAPPSISPGETDISLTVQAAYAIMG